MATGGAMSTCTFFNRVGVRIEEEANEWTCRGTYLTGIATQGTYWKEGAGGNVTVEGEKKVWTRTTAWEFPIQTIVG
jgi:hypothetical protein